ncbi:MAG: chloride channel protein [Candidatus Polarisedimenticolaceae bacterium]|nr:chloride channel protein [Candidatus Polarisedimenticolaceae bacterium]
MHHNNPHHSWIGQIAANVRLRLSRTDGLLPLSVIGLFTGLVAGAVIIAFRLLVEGSQASFLPSGLPDNYEELPLILRFVLPIIGGLVIGIVFQFQAKGLYMLGISRLLERLNYHQGYLTLREFLLQFFGAAVAIISGHSVGREGPNVFLGAASGSLIGQALKLPNNAIRTLVGCGTAAGIAASFNTPLAGVIFALEVVMMEYSLASFMPVILAAVSANALSILVFGSEPAFNLPELHLGSLKEIPLLFILGVVIGSVAALYNHLLQQFTLHSRHMIFWQRTTLAGLLVALCGLGAPEVLGLGYDTVNSALLGELGLGLLVSIILFKLLATAASIGLGIPGGTIGPTLVIGASIGSLTALLATEYYPEFSSNIGLYALLGMGATMGASLQAPLAALTAILELTQNPQVVMPGMLVIVVAGLTSSEIFGKGSLFLGILKASGLDFRTDPIMQALRKVGVASTMDRSFHRLDYIAEREKANKLLSQGPEWLLISKEGRPIAVMPAVDLARHLQESEEPEIHLMDIPARRLQVTSIHLQATLQEALNKLNNSGAEAIYVEHCTAPTISHIYGILTHEHIESAYRY